MAKSGKSKQSSSRSARPPGQRQDRSARQPREAPIRENVESTQEREGARNPSVNQPMPDRDERSASRSQREDPSDPSQSRRPGGSGDMSR